MEGKGVQEMKENKIHLAEEEGNASRQQHSSNMHNGSHTDQRWCPLALAAAAAAAAMS
jgi:hypothetical protein